MAAIQADVAGVQAGLSLQEVFIQGRNSFKHYMDQAFNNINELETAFIRAMSLEAELRATRAELAQAREEIRRLREHPQAEVHNAVVEVLLKRIEDMKTQQDQLMTRIADMTQEMTQMKTQLQHSVQVQAEEQVKRSAEDLNTRLQEAAKLAAKKVSDVMPLVARVDREWMDWQAVESFFTLASLGLNDELKPEQMRRVARVCALIGKAAGPSHHLAAFATNLHTRLQHSQAAGLQFIADLEVVHQHYKEQRVSQTTLQLLLRLAKSETLDDATTLLLRFEGLNIDPVLELLVMEGQEDWRMTLLELPKEKSEALTLAMSRGFDAVALNLLQLVCGGPEPLYAFSLTLNALLTNPQVTLSAEQLLLTVTAQVKNQHRDVLEYMCQVLRLIKPTLTPEEVDKVRTLVGFLQPKNPFFKATSLLAETFADFKDEEIRKQLGFGVLEWLVGKPRTEGMFVEWLLPLLKNSEEHAGLMAKLLFNLGHLNGEIEQSLPWIVGKLPLDKALSLALQLCKAPNLSEACASLVRPGFIADTLIARLQEDEINEAAACLHWMTAVKKRAYRDDLNLVEEVWRSIHQSPALLNLIKDMTVALDTDNLPYEVILQIPGLWSRAKDDPRMLTFCNCLLHQLPQVDVAGLITVFQQYTETPGTSLTTILTLAHIYIERALPPATLIQWIHTLGLLRDADPLSALFQKIHSKANVPTDTLDCFIVTVQHLFGGQVRADTCRSLEELLDNEGVLPLLTHISNLTNVTFKANLLDTACSLQRREVLQACTEFSTLLRFFERYQVDPPDMRQTLHEKSEEVTKLVQACVPLAQNPAMASLTVELLGELKRRDTADLLVLIAGICMDLVGVNAPTISVEQLGKLLIATEESKVRKLQASLVQVRESLVRLLTNERNISIEALDELLLIQLHVTELVHVRTSSLRFFDFTTNAWKQPVDFLQGAQIQVDKHSTWVLLQEGVFCCGGGWDSSKTAWKSAYILGLNGVVSQKQDMNVCRNGPGVLAFQLHAPAVYVFGGAVDSSKTVNSCEKFTNDEWSPLPSMQQARVYFNPCLFNGLVYLSGSTNSTAPMMEVFSPVDDSMLPLQFPLPANNYYCIAYVDREILVLHSKSFILKFEVGQDGQLRQTSHTKVDVVGKWQSSHPVISKSRGVFFFIQQGLCYQASMETGATVALFK